MFSRILLPVDPKQDNFSRPALDFAAEQARRSGARLTLLAVVADLARLPNEVAEPESHQAGLDSDARRKLATMAESVPDVATELVVTQGRNVSEAVLKQARVSQADLIVMASHDRGLFEGLLLGSVAERVARHSHCSVMLIRPVKQTEI